MKLRALAGIAAAGVFLVLSSGVAQAETAVTARTAQGAVAGKLIGEGRVKAFLGLPYAAPPVGERRWRAPAPAATWKGVRDATKFAPHCAQGRVFADMIFQDGEPSEDCLYLNVYAPADAKPGSKLPVMFWIHGGGYAGGASSEPRHNGDALPRKGVVLVTINYRLGVLGFLASSDLAAEGQGHAGNYGLLDMVEALRWVKGNIGGFGGDAGNVTIFGESAGSFAVSTLMASPLARGLFHRAIGESGAAFSGVLPTEALAERGRRDQQWVDAQGVKTLAEARQIPVEKLIEAAGKKGVLGFSPVVDGLLLTEAVPETFAAGRQAHVPLLAGWNRDENPGMANGMTAEKWKGFAEEHYGAQAGAFLKAFPGATDEEAVRSAVDFGASQFISFGTWKWIEAQVKTGQEPVYRYHFELAAPPSTFHPGSFAFHSDDIEYVFGTLDTRPGATWRPEDRLLSEQMTSYWTNFARTGDPNGKGLPVWPRYDTEKKLIHLDSTITSGADATRSQFEFLESQPAAAH
jgi:para-nitrobenzyl esterase